jgi:hypothetical protein
MLLRMIMIKKLFVTAVLALLPLSATFAQSNAAQNLPRADVSTEAMVALCQSRTDLEAQTFCYGFGEGVYQTYELNLDPKAPKTVCLPTVGVARDVVLAEFIQWALANPQYNKDKAAATVIRYLPIKFPCKG